MDGEAEELAAERKIRLFALPVALALALLFSGGVDGRVSRGPGRDADAEDVTQDAFIDALSNLSPYAPKPGVRFVAWL